jgi:hypothetical protein
MWVSHNIKEQGKIVEDHLCNILSFKKKTQPSFLSPGQRVGVDGSSSGVQDTR